MHLILRLDPGSNVLQLLNHALDILLVREEMKHCLPALQAWARQLVSPQLSPSKRFAVLSLGGAT